MNRLEHVNLVVKDINATLDFLQTAFPEWAVRGQGESEWYGQARKWLHVGSDDYYITLNQGSDEPNRDLTGHAPGLAHIGFAVDDMEAVSGRLQARGYEIGTIGAEHPYRKTAYFIDPAGFEFEFIQYLSDKPEEKNLYGGETSSITRVSTAPIRSKQMNTKQYVEKLYREAVDGRSADKLASFLADDVSFQMGNSDPITGKAATVEANRNFFTSIAKMTHTIDNIWVQNDNAICNGTVHYMRLDGSTHSATFATVLTLQNDEITNYQVYADLSAL